MTKKKYISSEKAETCSWVKSPQPTWRQNRFPILNSWGSLRSSKCTSIFSLKISPSSDVRKLKECYKNTNRRKFKNKRKQKSSFSSRTRCASSEAEAVRKKKKPKKSKTSSLQLILQWEIKSNLTFTVWTHAWFRMSPSGKCSTLILKIKISHRPSKLLAKTDKTLV